MNLTGFALNNTRLTGLLVAMLAIAGVLLFLNFPSKEDPEVTVREAVVAAYFPGMAPERVENLITRKLERQIRLIPEVKKIKSSSKSGVSIIHVTVYDKFFEMEPIWQNLRNKMAETRPELPQGTLGPFVNSEFGDVNVATIAVTAQGFSPEEMRKVARDIRDDLYSLDGIRRVEMHGVRQERIFLETTNARLARYGLSPDELIATLEAQNIILPGGRIDVGGYSIVIEPSGNFDTLEDIRETVITIPATQQVAYLRDVLEVRRAYEDPPQTLAYYKGKPAIVLAVSMQKTGVNVLDFGPRLKARVAEIEAELPVGYALDFATYQADYVKASVDGVTLNVYETLAIVLGMVMLFLGWRTGLIVGSIVPLTMLVSLVFMSLVGIELQRVSLATMIIALGLLVDNGIVIAEDIGRRMAEGAERRAAALATGKQLSLPLLTSSLTTILAFIPLMLASDSSGEYMRSMSLVIMITLLSSWALAMCFSPLLCVWFMGKPKKTPEQAKAAYDGKIYQVYRAFLRLLLRARVLFVGAIGAGLVGGFVLLGMVPEQFFPESSRNQFYIYLDLPNGATSKATDQTLRQVVDWLSDEDENPEVTSNVAYVGYGGPRFFVPLAPRDEDPHVGFILVTVTDAEAVNPVLERTRRYLAASHPEAMGRLKKFFLGNSETGLLEVRVRGRDLDKVAGFGDEVETALRAIPGTLDLHNNWENRTTKILVKIDQVRARRAGVTSEEIAQSLNTFFSGGQVSAYREGDQVIPILLRAADAERTNMDRLRSIEVYGTGVRDSVLLSQVADFVPVNQYSRIERYNLKRTVTIQAKHSWLQAAELAQALQPALQEIETRLPAGYSVEIGGEPEDAAKGEEALFEFVPHCLAFIVILLVWQFNSFAKPAIIFITIPLSFIGAAIGLLATGAFMGFMAMLGFLSLAGIIINNAIVLLDQIQVEIDQGATPYEAVINASVSRFQPVMMTTLTTILGLIPLMVPPDPLFFAMALVIAAGLSVGTLLTLAAVPVLYTLFLGVKIPRPVPDAGPDAGDAAPVAAE